MKSSVTFARLAMLLGIFAVQFSQAARTDVNTIPYQESFEYVSGQNWTNNGLVNTTNGWYSTVNDLSAITNLSYTFSNPCGLPLTNTHTRVVQLNTQGDTLSNTFSGQSFSFPTNIYIDSVLQFVPSDANPTISDTASKGGYFINTSSNLVIYHGAVNSSGVVTNTVMEPTLVVIDTSLWYRVTVTYASAVGSGATQEAFQVRVNGVLVTNTLGDAFDEGWQSVWANTITMPAPSSTGTWFMSAAAVKDQKLTSVSFSGTGYLDDLQVLNNNPLGNNITITAGTQSTTYGSSLVLGTTNFTVTGAMIGANLITSVTLTANGGTNGTDGAGNYVITPSSATGTGGFLAANYNITYATNRLTVNPRPTTLTGTRAYDSTTTAAAGILSVVNKVGSDDVSLASGSATLAGAAIGAHAITSMNTLALGGAQATNYTLLGGSGSVTITNLNLTITANARSTTYGTPLVLGTTNFAVTGGSLAGSEQVTSVTLGANGGINGTDDVAGYTITPSAATGSGGFLAANYSITYLTGALTVNQLPVNLTGTRAYDATTAAAAGILTVANKVGGDDITVASGNATLAGATVGAQSITSMNTLALGGAKVGNYTLLGSSGSVTISGAPITITAGAQSTTYGTVHDLGTTNFSVTGTLGGSEQVTNVTLVANGGTNGMDVVGPYFITPSAATGSGGFLAANYSINYTTNAMTVNQRPVTLTGTRAYDSTATAASGILSVVNKVGSDDVSLASGSATLAGAAVGANAISSMNTLALGGGQATNYTLLGGSGSVTITNLNLTITANARSTTYGTPLVLGTTNFAVTGGSLAGSEQVTSVTLGANGGINGTDDVAGYTITPSAATGSGGFLAANYSITYLTGALTVNQLPVNLTGTRAYDGTTAAAAGILTVANKVGGDDITVDSGNATLAGATVGAQSITSMNTLALGGAKVGNYTLLGGSGSVTISGTTITITAGAQSTTYGTVYDLGTTNFSVTGTLGGSEQITNVTLIANGGTNGTDGAGHYVITPGAATGSGGFLAANYTITYTTNAMTVNQRPVTLTGTRAYDSTATAASGILSVVNKVGSDDVSLASGSATLAGAAVGANAISSMNTLALGGGQATNYTLLGGSGSVTITNLNLTITANARSTTYGTPLVLGTTNFAVTGGSLAGSEQVTSVTLGANGGINGTDDVAGYTITPSAATGSGGFLAANYSITYLTGALTVNQLPVNLTGTRAYDATTAAAAGILTVANKVGGDDITVASGNATLAGATVGAQSITSMNTLALGGAKVGNYTLLGGSGSVTISGAPITITAGAQSTIYGTVYRVGTTNFSVTGTLGGSEQVTNVTLIANGGTNGTDLVGPYFITPSAATGSGGFLAANYSINYVTNALTLNQRPVFVTGTRAYDTTATASYSILTITNKVGSDDVSLASGSATLAGAAIGVQPIISMDTLALGGGQAANYTVIGGGGTLTINPTLTVSAGAGGTASFVGSTQIPYGGSTTVVFTADNWVQDNWFHVIGAVTSNSTAISAAIGKQVFTQTLSNVSADISYVASFVTTAAVVFAGDINITTNQILNVPTGGTLTVSGNLTIGGTASVPTGGTLIVSGSLTVSGTASITPHGTITCGQLLITSNATLMVTTGRLVVAGSHIFGSFELLDSMGTLIITDDYTVDGGTNTWDASHVVVSNNVKNVIIDATNNAVFSIINGTVVEKAGANNYFLRIENGSVFTNTGSTIKNCGVSGTSSAAGLFVDTPNATLDSVTLTNNYIGLVLGPNASGLVIHKSLIVGNTAYGIYNNGASLDATTNWWGAVNGPGGVAAGSGDAVSANVVYDPYLTQPLLSILTGYAFADEDSDSVLSGGDTAITNLTVHLMQGATQVASTHTDVSGEYQFAGLVPGNYTVVFLVRTDSVSQVETAPVAPPASTNINRTRAVVVGTNVTADVTVQFADGILSSGQGEPINIGFVSGTLAAAVSIQAYAAANGVVVEFETIDETGTEPIILQMFQNGQWVELGRHASSGGDSDNLYRFDVPELNAGDVCTLRVLDDQGIPHTVYNLTVGSFAAQSVMMDNSGFWLQWSSMPGRRYEIYRADQLGGSWTLVQSVTALTSSNRVYISYPAGKSAGFYKLTMP